MLLYSVCRCEWVSVGCAFRLKCTFHFAVLIWKFYRMFTFTISIVQFFVFRFVRSAHSSRLSLFIFCFVRTKMLAFSVLSPQNGFGFFIFAVCSCRVRVCFGFCSYLYRQIEQIPRFCAYAWAVRRITCITNEMFYAPQKKWNCAHTETGSMWAAGRSFRKCNKNKIDKRLIYDDVHCVMGARGGKAHNLQILC